MKLLKIDKHHQKLNQQIQITCKACQPNSLLPSVLGTSHLKLHNNVMQAGQNPGCTAPFGRKHLGGDSTLLQYGTFQAACGQVC